MLDKNFSRKASYSLLLTILKNLKSKNTDRDAIGAFLGFGGLKELLLPLEDLTYWSKTDLEVFDQVKEVHELLKGIFDVEYNKAIDSVKASMLTSFYTPIALVKSICNPLIGKLQGNSILDPSAGSGFFLQGMLESDNGNGFAMTAIEKDFLTAKILSSAYPELNVVNSGFEEFKSSSSFDLVISNIPFGQVSVYDPDIYKEANAVKVKSTTRIHNYFFVKGLDNLKDGGFLAYVVSSGLMDSVANTDIRKYLVSKSNFIEALRLPNNAFRLSGTSPVTDIIILQKDSEKGQRLSPNDKLFIQTGLVQIAAKDGTLKEVPMNTYYRQKQDRILGSLALGGQYSGESLDVNPIVDKDYIGDVAKYLTASLDDIVTVNSKLVSMNNEISKDVRVIPEKYPNRSTLKTGNLVTLGVECG